MKVLVLGAGGKTGSAVVQQAVAAGHQVAAFIHHVGGYQGLAGVTVTEGDATDADAVAGAVAGQDAVIDTIGGKTPYKPGITLEHDVAAVVITAMHRHAVRRLLVTSMVGEGDSVANATALVRILLKTFLRGATADKAAMEKNITASGLDWTIARPAILNDGPAAAAYGSSTPWLAARHTRSPATIWRPGWWPSWTATTTCITRSPWPPADLLRPGPARPFNDTYLRFPRLRLLSPI